LKIFLGHRQQYHPKFCKHTLSKNHLEYLIIVEKCLNRKLVFMLPNMRYMCPNYTHGSGTQPVFEDWPGIIEISLQVLMSGTHPMMSLDSNVLMSDKFKLSVWRQNLNPAPWHCYSISPTLIYNIGDPWL
jgi:hypothetical protein